jgi:uncharacterized protein (DUF1800 family)
MRNYISRGVGLLSPAGLFALIAVAPALFTAAGANAHAASQTIKLVATDADGANTGTARAGVPVSFVATVSAGACEQISWSLAGPGSIKFSGYKFVDAVYTPPSTLSNGVIAKIVATLSNCPTVHTSYAVNLINPLPEVSASSPSSLLTGATQTVSLSGTGFVPGMTVHAGGVSYPATVTSYNLASAQIPVAANAAGAVTVAAKNPAPGGGEGAFFAIPIPANKIELTMLDQYGNATSSAPLDESMRVSALVIGSAQTGVNWSVSGPGSISSSGVYTAPSLMPSDHQATITATLASNPAITASYPVTFVNPVPEVQGTVPAQAVAGGTTSVTVYGTGFVPATVISSSVGSVKTTYLSSTSMLAKVTIASGDSGIATLQAYNPSPGGGTGFSFPEAIAAPTSATAAARLLDQTTFGATSSLIQQVQQEGGPAWLENQFNTPPTLEKNITIVNNPACGGTDGNCAQSEWWKAALTGNDQLRQRVALALSELFVVSDDTVTAQATVPYQNLLAQDAFGDWLLIMKDVALSPAMGIYLNMLNSARGTDGQIANENFARENMQLFNLGLYLLNQDGTLKLDGNGNPQPVYTEAEVKAFARVFTGWTYANPDGSTPPVFNNDTSTNYLHPLVAVELWHDAGSKTLLNGTTLPAGQTAEQDMQDAMQNVFEHPNLPPFVSKLLIQHLVTSDPSPEYVSRVAAVFASDANHVRGNMRAVLTAIFTDPEARAGDTDATAPGGHLREPLLWFTNVMRGLGYVNIDPNAYYNYLYGNDYRMEEIPYLAPDVFNFFPPGYVIPGTALNAPEFGIENTATALERMNQADRLVNNQIVGFNVDLSATSPLGQIAVSQGPGGLVSALNTLFMHDQMDSNTRNTIIGAISGLKNPAQQVRVATYLVITSSEYKIIH